VIQKIKISVIFIVFIKLYTNLNTIKSKEKDKRNMVFT